MTPYTKADMIRMKIHPEYNENWLQSIIANDPSILGLGELTLLAKERRQPRAGRLDLLFAEVDSKRRYEVEIQLGSVDETHIIRTIEYWDIERKRYPNHEHCAVIIAEEITSRFLNVISLFNGHIPLIALQVKALALGNHMTVVFTKVLDELTRGEEDEMSAVVTRSDRDAWVKKSSPEILAVFDKLFGFIKTFDDACEPNYTKSYIGVIRNKIANNFVNFIPQKKSLLLLLKLPYEEEYTDRIEESDLDKLSYDSSFRNYRLILRPSDLEGKFEHITQFIKLAHEERMG